MTNSNPNSIEFESDLRKWQLDQWELIDDLEGGTKAMVARSFRWLPKFPNEKDETYELRQCLAELEPVYSDTLDRLSSKPFSQPITFENPEGVDTRLVALEENADGEGTDVTSWSKIVFREAIHRGVTFVLVDLPAVDLENVPDELKVSSADGVVTMSADGESRLMLPRLVHISARNLIGWREVKVGPTATPILDQIRIREVRVEPHGDFGDQVFEYIRVITRVGFEIWRREKPRHEVENASRAGLEQDATAGLAGGGSFVQVGQGTHSFGIVPLFPFFTRKLSSMVGIPALQSLADANLAHFKALSTHNVLMEHARRNLLFAKGMDTDMLDSIVWSQSTVIKTTNEKADLKTVGYQGSAHEASFTDLDRRDRRMRTLGANPMDPKSKTTATEVLADESGTTTNIQSWAIRFGRYLEELIAQSDRAIGGSGELPEKFRAKVFVDFSIEIEAASDMTVIAKAREEKDITQVTYLNEMKRRGILSDGVDVEVEVRDTEQEQADEVARFQEGLEGLEGLDDEGNPEDNPRRQITRDRQPQEA